MKYLFFATTILLSASLAQAQEVISAGGETQKILGYEISWTIGEPVIETVSDNMNTLTQGFHQPKLTVTAVNEFLNSNYDLEVYPNPTSDIVNIIFNKPIEDTQFSLFDNTGKLIQTRKITSTRTELNLKEFSSGTYIIKLITTNETTLQTFKIVKR